MSGLTESLLAVSGAVPLPEDSATVATGKGCWEVRMGPHEDGCFERPWPRSQSEPVRELLLQRSSALRRRGVYRILCRDPC